MTYIELINRFWDFYRVKKFSDIDTTLYYFLLNECNIRLWLNPFELQTRNIEICLNVSRKTIGEARNRLKQRGLIDFVEAQGRGPTTYLIEGADVTNNILSELFCVSVSVSLQKHKGNTNGNTKVTQGKHKGNTTLDSTLYIEDLRLKTKDMSPCGDGATSSFPEPSLFAGEEKKATRRKSKASKDPPSAPPTLEEVMQYFLSQDADKRLECWEESARRFFDNFNAVDWRDKFNRRITRWDSRANSWILDDEQRQKEKKQNERFQTDRRNNPSGGIPIKGKVTPNCGLKGRDTERKT